ncbi:hypothetical protein [Kribbella sp. CA-293567]|uniref:hypothetical protein n=1 Tax=Kribbella sp. CA-293567 TaxID=3002436 RepID=UPI0022DCE636|nr:hypothetical protein [Kribbella sp. CA-293567]WBQ03152.1 hypothetical protein OX958_24600 [Kribbella sp. CA-293567]
MGKRSLVVAGSVGALAMVLATGWYFGARHGDGPLGESGLGNQLCVPVGQAKDVTIG